MTGDPAEAPGVAVGARVQRATRFYKSVAAIVLTTILLFILTNLVCWATRPWWRPRQQGPTARFYTEAEIARVQPGLSADQFARLMEETWSRPVVYESYTHFKEGAYTGRYVNVHPNGFRVSRGQGPWPLDTNRCNIFLFGASSVFGYGVSDAQTIASALQEALAKALDRDVCVYNFGRAYYQSTQERVLFEQLLMAGAVPTLALFVDGENDFFFADGEPFTAEPVERFMNGEWKREAWQELLGVLPVVEAWRAVAGKRPRSTEDAKILQLGPEQPPPEELRSILDAACWRYLKNRELIERIAGPSGVQCCFVWQPAPTYKYDLDYHWQRGASLGRHWLSKYGYERMAQILPYQRPATNLIWCADMQEGLHEPLYVDSVHYSPRMCGLIALRIANELLERKLIR